MSQDSTTSPTVVERTQISIGGELQDSHGGEIVDVRSPSDGHLVGRGVLGTPTDIARAVAAAKESFDSRVWQETSAADRADVLDRAANILEARSEHLVDLITNELGCTRTFSERGHVPNPIRHLRTFAALARSREWQSTIHDGTNTSLVVEEPVGVVGALTPWNGPLSSPAIKIGPALAAGCSVVAKPSPEIPLSLFELSDALYEAGLPAGVLSVVPGGRNVGEALVADPRVDKIAFTGSSATGRAIAEVCARRVARVTLELGGKSAAIVLPGADVEATARALVPMAMAVNGQLCISQSRILIHDSLYDEVVAEVARVLDALVVGDAMDPGSDVGPMVSEAHRARVESYIKIARDEGARVAAGGGRPSGLDQGWFVEPTLFADVTNDMRIAREEVFGPVMAAIRFSDVDDAVAIANDSPYGLSGSVWGDPEQALGVARKIRTGMVSLNGLPQAWGSPFGGFKESGLGREMGAHGLTGYVELKSIAVGS
ncbi:Aldehyde dehydrogenase [metagenome]|uniref:Aldehyde dehydrogenase n=1 Tax=metagenome TaxID=256318 RepID=A0A2P2CA70_9ZZZZ